MSLVTFSIYLYMEAFLYMGVYRYCPLYTYMKSYGLALQKLLASKYRENFLSTFGEKQNRVFFEKSVNVLHTCIRVMVLLSVKYNSMMAYDMHELSNSRSFCIGCCISITPAGRIWKKFKSTFHTQIILSKIIIQHSI